VACKTHPEYIPNTFVRAIAFGHSAFDWKSERKSVDPRVGFGSLGQSAGPGIGWNQMAADELTCTGDALGDGAAELPELHPVNAETTQAHKVAATDKEPRDS